MRLRISWLDKIIADTLYYLASAPYGMLAPHRRACLRRWRAERRELEAKLVAEKG